MPNKPTDLIPGETTLVWTSQSLLPSRKGDRCQLVASLGGGKRVAVRFWDGTRAVAPVECVRGASAAEHDRLYKAAV